MNSDPGRAGAAGYPETTLRSIIGASCVAPVTGALRLVNAPVGVQYAEESPRSGETVLPSDARRFGESWNPAQGSLRRKTYRALWPSGLTSSGVRKVGIRHGLPPPLAVATATY